MKKRVSKFGNFVKEYRFEIMLSIILLCVTWYVRLTQYSFSIDTEAIINNYDAQMQGWLTLGRYGLVFIKWILHLKPFDCFLALILTVIALAFSAVLSYYIFYEKFYQPKKCWFVIFFLLFTTHPILAEQFNFLLQSAEVAITFIIADIGILFLFEYSQSIVKRIVCDAIAIVLFTLCLGVYQSFAVFILTMIAIYLCLLAKYNKDECSFKLILECAIVFILSFVGYTIVNKAIQVVLDIPSSSYLTNQILWGKEPFIDTIKSLCIIAYDILRGGGIYYNLLFTVVVIFSLIEIVKNFKKNTAHALLLLCVLFVPYTLTILLGHSEVYRAQIAVPLMVALVMTFIIQPSQKKNLGSMIVVISSILAILIQSVTTFQLFSSDYARFEEEKDLAQQLMADVYQQYGVGSGENQVVFVGERFITSNQSYLKGEMMSASFFAWDTDTQVGGNDRIIGFLNALGYNLDAPNAEQYSKALEIMDSLDVYPSKNSIKEVDGLVVIRLS